MSMLINATTGIQNATWGNTGRPTATAIPGQQGYNSDTGLLETYNGSSWVAAGGSTFCDPLVLGNSIVANGSAGTTSQVLMSGGACATPQWVCGSTIVGTASPNVVSYTSSTTFTVTTPGTYTIHVIGAGGSSGTASGGGCVGRATGGGAGGYARKTALLAAGCYNITVGAGATQISTCSPAAGTPGGASSFSGPGITTITANGGAGGTAASSAGTSPGAAGGTATGGDINVTGGGSGTAISVNKKAATGGGAVGILGTGYSSLSATGCGTCQSSLGAGVGSSSGSAGNGGLGYAFPFGGLTGNPGGATSGSGGAGIFAGGAGEAGSGGRSGGNGGGGGGGVRGGGVNSNGAGGPGMIIITN